MWIRKLKNWKPENKTKAKKKKKRKGKQTWTFQETKDNMIWIRLGIGHLKFNSRRWRPRTII